MRSFKFLSVVGLVLFLLILSSVDVAATTKLILDADKLLLMLGLGFVGLEVLVRSLNWMVLAGVYSRGYGYLDALKTYLIGIAFGAVTPGKAGDLIKVADLTSKTGLTSHKALTIGLLDRLINFIVLFLTAGACVVVVGFVVFSGDMNVMVLLIPITATVVAVYVIQNEGFSTRLLRPLHSFLIPERYRKDTKKLYKTFHKTVDEFKKSRQKVAVGSLTLMGWAIIFVRPLFFGKAIGMDVAWEMFVLFIPIISVAEVLPLSILGLGTRDTSVILLFSLMGVDRESMVALSAMMLIFSIVPQAVVGYLIAFSQKVRVENEGIAC